MAELDVPRSIPRYMLFPLGENDPPSKNNLSLMKNGGFKRLAHDKSFLAGEVFRIDWFGRKLRRIFRTVVSHQTELKRGERVLYPSLRIRELSAFALQPRRC